MDEKPAAKETGCIKGFEPGKHLGLRKGRATENTHTITHTITLLSTQCNIIPHEVTSQLANNDFSFFLRLAHGSHSASHTVLSQS